LPLFPLCEHNGKDTASARKGRNIHPVFSNDAVIWDIYFIVASGECAS
jgi:hypothetical protein